VYNRIFIKEIPKIQILIFVIDINIIIESQFAIADIEFLKIIAIWTVISVSVRVSHINYKLKLLPYYDMPALIILNTLT